jgi:hypothetical protein
MSTDEQLAKARVEWARLHGRLAAMRYLLEQTWASGFIKWSSDPLAACDAAASDAQDRERHGEAADDPSLAQAIAQASDAEIESFFGAVRGHIENELQRRAKAEPLPRTESRAPGGPYGVRRTRTWCASMRRKDPRSTERLHWTRKISKRGF